MLTIFVNGLMSGIWFLGAMLPSLLLLLIAVGVHLLTKKDEVEDFMEDFPPDIPTREPEFRFPPGTIVRPPDIKPRKEEEEDKDDDDKS